MDPEVRRPLPGRRHRASGQQRRLRDLTLGLRATAERQLRSAACVAALLGFLSLLVGLSSWRERGHLDLELALGFADSAALLGLSFALTRHLLWAAWALLGLAGAGAVYTLWLGAPPLTILPQVVSGIVYARAIGSLRFLRRTRARSSAP